MRAGDRGRVLLLRLPGVHHGGWTGGRAAHLTATRQVRKTDDAAAAAAASLSFAAVANQVASFCSGSRPLSPKTDHLRRRLRLRSSNLSVRSAQSKGGEKMVEESARRRLTVVSCVAVVEREREREAERPGILDGAHTL